MAGPWRTLKKRSSPIPRLSACLALAVVLAGCGTSGGGTEKVNQAAVDAAVKKALAEQAATEPDDAPAETQFAEEVPAAPVEAQAPPAAEDDVDFVMPSFVGVNLQEAQDEVQSLGVFFSVSHDVLGARGQFIDSNWKVCTQTPAAGTPIKGSAADHEGTFDFGAVKLTEACP